MEISIVFIAKYLVFVSAAIAAVFFLRQPRARQKEILLFAVILLPLSYIMAKIISCFFFNPRPFVVDNLTPLIQHAADNGFPSEHTLFGAAVAAAVFHFNKKVGMLLALLATLVGAARVLAGVHHWADILGSISIVLLAYLMTLIFRRFNLRNKKYAQKRIGGK